MVSAFRRAGYRIGQLGRGLVPWVSPRDRALALAALTERQYAAFRLMNLADQRHSVRVTRALLAEGARDPDLIVAALLHDLGKVDALGGGRVRLVHRVAKVILARFAPAYWRRISDEVRTGPTRGFYLLRHHPALGATWAAALGASPRACALIAAHQEGDVCSADAAALVQLRRADDSA